MLVFFKKKPWKVFLAFFIALSVINLIEIWVYDHIKSIVTTGSVQKILPIYRVGIQDKRIAISFDATWGTDYTDKLLDTLNKHNVKATFFLAGFWIEKNANYVKLIASKGHEIGNHSWTHPHMNTLSRAQIVAELTKTNDALRELTGKQPTLFRPPFGEYSDKVILAARECGMETIQWDVDSLDWQNLSADAIVERVMSRVKPGSIVLFHNNGTHTVEAVNSILSQLKAQGYQLVSISKLLLNGETWVDVNGEQRT